MQKKTGHPWLLGALLLLAAAIVLQSGLLAYAMYVLLGVLLVSRLLAHDWIAHLEASRDSDISNFVAEFSRNSDCTRTATAPEARRTNCTPISAPGIWVN